MCSPYVCLCGWVFGSVTCGCMERSMHVCHCDSKHGTPTHPYKRAPSAVVLTTPRMNDPIGHVHVSHTPYPPPLHTQHTIDRPTPRTSRIASRTSWTTSAAASTTAGPSTSSSSSSLRVHRERERESMAHGDVTNPDKPTKHKHKHPLDPLHPSTPHPARHARRRLPRGPRHGHL